VLAYWNERDEDEYLVLLPRSARPTRLPWGMPKLKKMAARYKPDTFHHDAVAAEAAKDLTGEEILRALRGPVSPPP
jgi:hypothetical protein